MEPWRLVVLGLSGLVGGIGITALGPGGVVPTIALFALTSAGPAVVAGTAIVTHVATGALGTAAYVRSGHLAQPEARRAALVLAGAAVVGTPLGVVVNARVSPRGFGLVLAALAVVVAALVVLRHRGAPEPDTDDVPGTPVLAAVGVGVGLVSGVVGIGGPMLTVPLLVGLRVRPLTALAAAQAQSIVIAGVGTVGYAVSGSIDWVLALVVGVPELAGVLVGWRIARAVPARALRVGIVVALLAVAPYLALRAT